MTQHKHLKQLVRARMQKTGESYAAARRQIVQQVAPSPLQSQGLRQFPHFPGIVPAAAGLRVLFTHAGILAPHTGQPLSEPMVFGIAGGIGAGVFAFHYAKEDFSSFFVAGRHLWQDDVAYTRSACERVGLVPVVTESSGAKSAEKQLLAALDAGPVLAWVDMAHLPHRELPKVFSGMVYHLVTVYDADSASGTARIGDLSDEPIERPGRRRFAERRTHVPGSEGALREPVRAHLERRDGRSAERVEPSRRVGGPGARVFPPDPGAGRGLAAGSEGSDREAV
jgi:hypothetical protein